MITLRRLEQEFFIYVPILDTAEASADISTTRGEETTPKEVGINPIYDGWVKILLQGRLVVYARLLDE